MNQQQITTQELTTQAIVGVLSVSIIASAMGMLIAAVGIEAIPAGVRGAKPTLEGIEDLRSAFGASLVNTAVDNVGRDDIVTLAMEVERLYVGHMKWRYGDWATEQALATAPAGDVRAANEIASTLQEKRITETSTPETKQAAVGEGKKKAGRRAAQPVKDTHTGKVYGSKASAGMSVAAEYGLDPKNHFIWYEVIKKDPERFVRVSTELAAQHAPEPKVTVTQATPATKKELVYRFLPEYGKVLLESGGYKPRKFVEAIEVIVAPAPFVPSAQGDYAYTKSFVWDGKALTSGPSYSYDTMLTVGVSPYEREVDVLSGNRVWIVTYDGQWGGYWSRVHVYVHRDDPAVVKMLPP